jgi:hypothetical protein
MAVCAADGRADNGPPKVGTVITLNIDGKGDRSFKVIKSEKQPDGTYASELKDTKTGETITLVDKTGDAPPAGGDAPKAPDVPKAPDAPKDSGPPKAKSRASDPLLPTAAAALPDANKDKDKDGKRPVIGRLFGDKDKPAMPAEMPATPPPPAPEKKPGLFGRVFGPKKPTGPAMPAAATPATKPTPAAPPTVIPTPPGGVSTTAEPPRVMPSKPAPAPVAPPVATPAPVTPAPSIPTPLPPASAPVPIPTPLPAPPSIPTPLPPAPALPPIPIPPGGTSSAAPVQQVVVPANFLPTGVAFDRDVQPFVIALQTMDAPSARITAAKGLAEGRHGSTDGVKGALFQAAQLDPCPEVRAECIGHLCKLGYHTPQFLGFIQAACDDTSPVVRDAAKAACAKMIRQK